MAERTTKGSRALAALTKERGAASRLAKTLNVGADRVSQWAHGQVSPNTKHRILLAQYTGIGLADWDVEVKPRKRAVADRAPESPRGAA